MSGEPAPWIQGELVIERRVLEDIHAHAIESFPSECCGFVSGPNGEALLLDKSSRQENEADKYHELDPVQFPRTSRMYFKMNEMRAVRAFEQGKKSGQPIKVIYHSHCDAGAYFSAEDAATFALDGQLTWDCAFIVVSVMQGQLADTKLWVHVPETNQFRESSLTVR
jgi:[CysO sulfur-carrier protein]-S-L-cysteine hydrolase